MSFVPSLPTHATARGAVEPLSLGRSLTPPDTKDSPDVTTLSRLAIAGFLSRSGLDISAQPRPHAQAVEQRAREIAQRWDIGDANTLIFNRSLATAISVATTAWASTSPDLQVYNSLVTTLILCIDDFTCPPNTLAEFAQRLLSGSRQLHPLLDCMAEMIAETKNHFLPLVSNDINRAIIAFVDVSALEFEMVGVALCRRSSAYVEIKRQCNGIGRGYALFSWDKAFFPDITRYIQAVPELTMFINYVNDIFSFYKEELDGETANYIHERAAVTGKSLLEALYDTVDDAVASVAAAREILIGTAEGEACEAVMRAYTRWHMINGRYRLGELFGNDLETLLTSSISTC